MTTLSKTGQFMAGTLTNARQAPFEASQAQIALQPPQMDQPQNITKHVRPPLSAKNTIVKTNTVLKTNTRLKLPPQKPLPSIQTPALKLPKVINLPKVLPPAQLAPNIGAGAAALGAGEFVAGAKVITGGIISTGTLVTAGLFALTFGGVFLHDTKGFNTAEEDTLRKLKAKKNKKMRDQTPKNPAKPQFTPLPSLPLGPSIEENRQRTNPFVPKHKPLVFNPVKKTVPLPTAQPAHYKPVPDMLPVPHVRPAPKGGSVTKSPVDGVEFAPIAPNYVGARKDVQPSKPSDKKAKGQVRGNYEPNRGEVRAKKDKATTHQPSTNVPSNAQARAEKLQSNPPIKRGPEYWTAYDGWCKLNGIKPETVQGDPYKKDETQLAGFHTLNGATHYTEKHGEKQVTHDASVFDDLLESAEKAQQNLKLAKEKKRVEAKRDKTSVQTSTKLEHSTKPNGRKLSSARQRTALQATDYQAKMNNAADDAERILITNLRIKQVTREVEWLNKKTATFRKGFINARKNTLIEKNEPVELNPQIALSQQTLDAYEKNKTRSPQIGNTLADANELLDIAKKDLINAHTRFYRIQKEFHSAVEKLSATNPIKAEDLSYAIEAAIKKIDRNHSNSYNNAKYIEKLTPEQVNKKIERDKLYQANKRTNSTEFDREKERLRSSKRRANLTIEEKKEKKENRLKNEPAEQRKKRLATQKAADQRRRDAKLKSQTHRE
jgi:hypothetical protein